MKITIFGSGYVGLVTGICLSEVGHDVICVDIDRDKIALLNKGKIPIYEPGLEKILLDSLKQNNIRFTDDVTYAVNQSDILFIAVGTPEREDGSANLQYVEEVASSIGKNLNNYKLIVSKSTVPVGTGETIKQIITSELSERNLKVDFDICSNPEFLKEGSAVEDFSRPDRIIIGASSDKAFELMSACYEPFNRSKNRIIKMSIRASELTKYASNAMLATKISFMNELSNLADKLDVDIEDVRNGMGSDSRIGYQFIYPGCGYGGSCFPKDVSALIDMHEENNISGNLIKAVDDVNKNQRDLLFKKINFIFESLANKKISIWGLAFKPETDDIREAPSNYFIDKALKAGAFIQAYDPIAIENARKRYSQVSSISFFDDQMECLDSSEALVIFTECKSFRQPNFAEIKSRMALPIIIDGRNLYNPNQLRDLGIDYYGIGRGRRI